MSRDPAQDTPQDAQAPQGDAGQTARGSRTPPRPAEAPAPDLRLPPGAVTDLPAVVADGLTPRVPPRRSKFRNAYCAELIEHMKKGMSYESFAATIGVSDTTLYNWEPTFPQWSRAKEVGRMARLHAMETLGQLGIRGKIKGFNVVAWKAVMSHAFGWRDHAPAGGTNVQVNVPVTVNYTEDWRGGVDDTEETDGGDRNK